MTAYERIALRLAERLDGLDAAAMARHSAFRQAVDAALAILDEEAVIDRVVAQGPLRGAVDPHRVITRRMQMIGCLDVVDAPSPPSSPAALEHALDLLGALPGLHRAVLAGSPTLAGVLARCLASADAEAVLERVVADGPLDTARSPVGVLVHRLKGLAEAFPVEAERERLAAREAAVERGRMLAGLVGAGTIPLDAAETEIAGAGLWPEQKTLALAALHASLHASVEVPR